MFEEDQCVFSFHYRLWDISNAEPVMLESTDGKSPVNLLSGRRQMLPGVEEAMRGKEVGEPFSVELSPEQAYGKYREDGVHRVPIKHLLQQKKLAPGAVVAIKTRNAPVSAVVKKVGKFTVDVDTNHPLAGKSLRFDIEITARRAATPEELETGALDVAP
ncbi:MAG: FKBP-type peptidyl-prolyl cis-trans isomerase [bacterium]